MLGLRSFTWRKAIALVLLGGAVYATWQWNTARLRREFIAEIQQRGGRVGIGPIYPSGYRSGPSATFWDKIGAEFERWRTKERLRSVEIPDLLSRRDAQRMQLLATIEKLELREADDEALSALPKLPKLETLRISSTQATDAGLTCLKQMPELSDLELRGRGFTDAAPLVAHPKLAFVDVSETAISETGLASLIGCSRLIHFTADRIGVTGRELPTIPTSQIAIFRCSLAGNPLTDQALAKLYAAPMIESVDASEIAHGPAALAALAANRTLSELTLNDVRTDWDSLVEALASMTQLTDLSLEGARLKPEHLKRLLRLPKLERLLLDRSTVTQEMYDKVIAELNEKFDDGRHGRVIITHDTWLPRLDEPK